jgi:hypothetical protein
MIFLLNLLFWSGLGVNAKMSDLGVFADFAKNHHAPRQARFCATHAPFATEHARTTAQVICQSPSGHRRGTCVDENTISRQIASTSRGSFPLPGPDTPIGDLSSAIGRASVVPVRYYFDWYPTGRSGFELRVPARRSLWRIGCSAPNLACWTCDQCLASVTCLSGSGTCPACKRYQCSGNCRNHSGGD